MNHVAVLDRQSPLLTRQTRLASSLGKNFFGLLDMDAISGARWVALSQAVRIATQVVGMILIARLVGPSEYGIMAMASVVTNFALIFRDMGSSSALIQKVDVDDRVKTAVFWFNVTVGAFMALLACGISPLVASLFNTPKLQSVLIVLGLAFPVASLGAVHQSLLERDHRFRPVAIGEVMGSLVGLVGCIAFALLGAGVYSLVAQVILSTMVTTCVVWMSLKWRPSKPKSGDFEHLRSILGFSTQLVGFNLINYAARNADAFIAARFFGAAALGAYSLSYRVMLFPLQSLTFVATRALYPSLSRMQNDLPALADTHKRLVLFISVLVSPMMAGMIVVRDDFIHVIAGPGWEQTAALLIWLAPTGLLQAVSSTTSVFYMAIGRTRDLLAIGFFNACIQIVAIVAGASVSIEAMAASYMCANIVILFTNIKKCRRQLGARMMDVIVPLAKSALCATIMAAFVYLSKILMQDIQVVSARLAFCAAIGCGTYALLLRVIMPVSISVISGIIRPVR